MADLPNALGGVSTELERIEADAVTFPAPLAAEIETDVRTALPAIEADLATRNFPAAEQAIGALAQKIATDVVDQFAAPCFTSDVRIRTAHGDVAVEHLRVGDVVVTAAGAHRPIRWIGSRRVDCCSHPRPGEVMPVRIAAHAFGPDRPARDLRVSPGHAICLDLMGELLVPAGSLVNGATVTQEAVDAVTYWHVELDGHDVLLAENLPCESYLDMGNRTFFADHGVVALDASPDAEPARRTHADFCRPFHADGPFVDVARAQLTARAHALGWRLAERNLGDLHLVADGARVEPVVRGLVARFAVPAGARQVWLVSEAARPCDVGDGADVRRLGVQVGGLAVADGFGPERRLAMDDARLDEGWHEAEGEAARPVRWTAGRARLPADLWGGDGDGCYLRAELALAALPRWVAPLDRSGARAEAA